MKNFDPNVSIYAGKEITLQGQTYQQGDPIDWFELGLSERRIRQLFEQRKVTHLPQYVNRDLIPQTKSTVEVRRPSNDDVVGDYIITEKSKNWYQVLDMKTREPAGEKMLRRAAAILLAEELTEKKHKALDEKFREIGE
jgi:hypothetical protein